MDPLAGEALAKALGHHEPFGRNVGTRTITLALPPLSDASVLVEIHADMCLEPADHVAQEVRETLDFVFEPLDARLDGGLSLAVLRNLALLVEVPEQSHAAPFVTSRRHSARSTRRRRCAMMPQEGDARQLLRKPRV